ADPGGGGDHHPAHRPRWDPRLSRPVPKIHREQGREATGMTTVARRADTAGRAGIEQGSILLEAQNLGIRYGGVVAVDDVSLGVRAGEVVGLVGPNGAGKTTLVDLITGAQRADSGTLRIQGDRVRGGTAKRARMGLARTFQHPLLDR